MNQKIWNSLTALLLTTALGTPLIGRSQPSIDRTSQSSNLPSGRQTFPATEPRDVVKVGEYQSETDREVTDAVIAKIQPHEITSHQAATLYIRNIPVLTFVGASTAGDDNAQTAQTKMAVSPASSEQDPVWRATELAAKLNQMNLDSFDAKKITVSYTGASASDNRYTIKINGEKLVEINADTRLPDTTNDRAKDALQATNRMRRLLGNAPPLNEISGMPRLAPKLTQQISIGPVRVTLSGWASWYGPGFHGNRSASGEVYNQNALTAAHRSLPFGTQVRVTNTSNGRSVVVRINDRGPFIRGRIIDLSAAAARMLGLMQTGVAPVRVEVLNQSSPPISW